jgi:Spy/CpxP family protein refolding chaperone
MARRVSLIAIVLVAVGGAIALTVPNALLPQPSPSPYSESSPAAKDKLSFLRDLNLNPDQLQKIQAVRRKHQAQMGQQRQAVQQSRREFEIVMASDAPKEQVRQKYRQHKVLKDRLDEVRFEALLEMREVLTPAQRIKFAENMQRRHSKSRELPMEKLESPTP